MDIDDIPEDDGPDRDTWVTPLWLANAIGPVELDPCSNERAHILAKRRFDLARGEDGLVLSRFVKRDTRTHINPPYSRGSVIRWIEAYRHVRWNFLLRFDITTKWFRTLWPMTEMIVIPMQRIDFEPPPGAHDAGSIYFPHALFYKRASDVTKELREISHCFADLSKLFGNPGLMKEIELQWRK